jgi:hypothetical protein
MPHTPRSRTHTANQKTDTQTRNQKKLRTNYPARLYRTHSTHQPVKITHSTLIVHARRLVLGKHPNARNVRTADGWQVTAGSQSFPPAARTDHAWENAARQLYTVV